MSITAETRLEAYDLIQSDASTRRKVILNYLREKAPIRRRRSCLAWGFQSQTKFVPG